MTIQKEPARGTNDARVKIDSLLVQADGLIDLIGAASLQTEMGLRPGSILIATGMLQDIVEQIRHHMFPGENSDQNNREAA